MRKPINPIALAFWWVAALFIIGDVPVSLALRQWWYQIGAPPGVSHGGPWPPGAITVSILVNVWSETRSALLGGGQLIGFGVLIELVDQIRWNGLAPDKQVAHRPVRDAIRRIRNLGVKG